MRYHPNVCSQTLTYAFNFILQSVILFHFIISFVSNIREGVFKFQPTHLIGLSAFVLFIIAMIDLHDDVELLALYMADSFDLLLTFHDAFHVF